MINKKTLKTHHYFFNFVFPINYETRDYICIDQDEEQIKYQNNERTPVLTYALRIQDVGFQLEIR